MPPSSSRRSPRCWCRSSSGTRSTPTIRTGDFGGVLRFAALLLAIFLLAFVSTYVQTKTMGSVGRRVLFALRNTLFTKLQHLPLDFFNQNKAGDLISRINNDTDKLNQFFAQSLVQLAANLFMMAGATIFLVALNVRLGLAALGPAIGVFLLTRMTGPWVRRKNVKSLQSLGALSAEIQESLANFKVIVAFNRRDYFRQKFDEANVRTFSASVASGLANNVFMPVYGLAYNLAQVVVLLYGIHLIAAGSVTIGLLIGFLMYVNSFYLPLRQLAVVWTSFQLALAGLDRISAVLALESNMPVSARRGGTGQQCATGVRARGFRLSLGAVRSCTTPPSRSNAERRTRWSDRPGAVRPPRRH